MGEELQAAQTLKPNSLKGHLLTWRMVYSALQSLQPAEQVLQNVAAPNPEVAEATEGKQSFELLGSEVGPPSPPVDNLMNWRIPLIWE